MKLKNIFILSFALIFFSIVSVQATTYLNSCGKNSGWVSGEEYILNFTNIPSSYLNDYCFLTDSSNLKFNGEGRTIINEKPLLKYFIQTNGNYGNYTFEDINVENSGGTFSYSFFNFRNSWADDFYFKNVKAVNFRSFIDYYQVGTTTSCTSTGWGFDNVTFIGSPLVSETWFLNDDWRGNVYCGHEINNSYINADKLKRKDGTLGSLYGVVNRSVLDLENNANDFVSPEGWTYEQSIFEGYPHVDSNGDGNADSIVYTGLNNMKTQLNLNGINYFQDWFEGENSFSIAQNQPSKFIENEQIVGFLGLTAPVSSPNNKYPVSFSNITILDTIGGLILTGGVDCSVVTNKMCNILDSPLATTNESSKYKGLISLEQNSLFGDYTHYIKNIDYDKLAPFNAHIVANRDDNIINDIVVTQNDFTKSDKNYKGGDNYFLKLYANNLVIENNIFFGTTTGVGGYEMLWIDSNTPLENRVTYNIFNQSSSGNGQTEIFTDESDTKFFDNYIGSGVNISNTAKPNLVTTSLYSYIYSGDVYFWNVGNYYEDNTGCVDSDLNGRCDSSFTSGAVEDLYPLVSYPFEPTSYLLKADYVVPFNPYNITLIDIVDNETINLDTGSENLIFSFSQNSEYPDLVCFYVIDGLVAGNQENPSQDVQYNLSYKPAGDWTEKTYTYQVQCYNEVTGYTSSSEFDFIITIGDDETGTGGGTDLSTVEVLGSSFSFNNLFSGDLEVTSEEIPNFFQTMTTPMIILFYLGLILAVCALIFFVIGIPLLLIYMAFGGKN